MAFIIIYVTHSNMEEAKRIAFILLKKRLIACVNFFPIESVYWWKGNVENAHEIVSLLKTKTENWEKIKVEIETIHPYETPCIIKIDAKSNEQYEEWINAETE